MRDKNSTNVGVAIAGWLLLAFGSLVAFVEPHQYSGELAMAGAILITGERVASAISRRDSP